MRTTDLPEGPRSSRLAEVPVTLVERSGETIVRREWRLGSDGNQVTVPVVRPVAERPPPSTLDCLAHEYELRDELDGRRSIKPLELVRDAGRAMLVLEDTGCKPLDRLLGVPMELGCFLRLAIGIAAALGKLHARGFVHKDIKPANIQVNDVTGEARLTGFGIASRVPRERQSPDAPETIAGTLAYMAPEQTGRMNRSIDSRSDLYSLGITLYQMLTGSLPFSAADPVEWVHCHIARHPAPPNERMRTIPAAVAAIVLKLLAKNAEDRYQTAAGVESDLRHCLSEWEGLGRIDSFLLGTRDASERLLIPEKLFGRELEIRDLFETFNRVVANETTDVLISGYAGIGKSSVVLAFETVWHLVEKGDELADVLASSNRYAIFAQQSRNDAVYETIRLGQRFIASLQGTTKDPLIFDDSSFDEAACLAVIDKASLHCGKVFYHLMKQILAVIYGRYTEAMASAERAELVLGTAMAMPIEATHHFCQALTLAALCSTNSPIDREHRRLLDEKATKLRLWAEHSPENYRNRYALICAEIARIEGRDGDAMRFYEEAIRSAHENGLLQNEAIASELAGRFYLAAGLETNGYAHLRKARGCFSLWGAHAKVKQLESLYAPLAAAERYPRAETMDSAIQKLDVMTVVKASQLVSGEIELARLIEQLMIVALENAGADRGLLILPRKDEYRVEAIAEVSSTKIVVRHKTLPARAVPESLVRYVIRTRESVIIDDARRANQFAGDEYLIRRQPRSVFCLPLVRQGAVAGVLYLENTLMSHVFTPDRTALLSLLASQLAISLENTRLYSDLREGEAKIQRLVDANVVGIIISDLESRMIEANDAFLQMVGYAREDLVSGRLHWTDLTPSEWHGQTLRALAELNRSGSFQPYEKEYFRKDGTRVPVLVGGAAFGDPPNQAVAFVVDLSERKQAEAVARESDQRHREMQMELAHANRLAIMGQLTASIAHEVTQPIAATMTNAHAALRWLGGQTPDVGEVRQALGRIVKDGERAGEVVGRIRDLIKKVPPRKDRLQINETIREVLDLAHSEAAKNSIALQTELADDLPPVQGDRVELQQVLLNLIINAVEALASVSDGPREVLISSEKSEADSVLVAVRDSGPGLAPASLDRLFEAFYTTKSSGLGLGLSICRSIIEAHGGRLWASANAPRGAVFQFAVPIHRDSTT